jgi:lipopolysaccharide transport protein LptA
VEHITQARLEIGGEQQIAITLASAQVEDSPLEVQGVEVKAVSTGEKSLEVSGASSRWDLDSGKVEFEGNVRLAQGDVELRCSRLEAEYKGDALRTAKATGDVRVQKDGAVATGRQAVWDASQGTVTLTGDAILKDASRRLRGAEIVIYLDERRLECRECSLIIVTPGAK